MQHKRTRPALEWHAEAQQLAAQGLSKPQIAKRLGRSLSGVYGALDPEGTRERRRESKARYDRAQAQRLPIYHGDHIVDLTRVDFDVWEAMRGTRLNIAGPGYAVFWVKAKRRHVYLHHHVLGVHLTRATGLTTDHINRDKTDNRRRNLRIVTPKENCANRGGKFEKAA